jgi:hypothetical protein
MASIWRSMTESRSLTRADVAFATICCQAGEGLQVCLRLFRQLADVGFLGAAEAR